jgi:hypothetical protein
MKKIKIFPKFPNPKAIVPVGKQTVQQPIQFTYRGGPLLANVEVTPVFWGSAWENNSQLSQLRNKLNGFFDSILQSSYLDQLGEFNTQDFPIGRGKRLDSFTVTDSNPFFITFDFSIQNMLKTRIQKWNNRRPGHKHIVLCLFTARCTCC